MILIDANILLYAYDESSPQHRASREWLEEVLSEGDLVRLAWLTVWAFVRISTIARLFTRPLTVELVMDAALAAIAIEHGATLCSTDRDFSRFDGLSWRNPVAAAG